MGFVLALEYTLEISQMYILRKKAVFPQCFRANILIECQLDQMYEHSLWLDGAFRFALATNFKLYSGSIAAN